MRTVLVARGLPGSGKSTWLRAEAERRFGKEDVDYSYIDRDSIREYVVGDKKWSQKLEGKVIKERNLLLRSSLKGGWDVVVDETFLNPKMLEQVRSIVEEFDDVELVIKDFTHVDIGTCIERDRTRGKKSVGAGVIRENAKKWLRAPKPASIPGAPNAVICDLDGTLALFDGNPYDRDWSTDTPNAPIVTILRNLVNTKILITSGRIETARAATIKWLHDNDIPYDELFMRPEARRSEKDILFKRDIYRQEIEGKYNIAFVLDDRDQVVDMWRMLGLTCLQVDYGNF